MGPRRRAFTIIELLVCVSVVSALIAILVPALADARRAAQRTGCLATLAGLGSASVRFGTDHRGLAPNLFARAEMVISDNLANFSTGTTTTGAVYLSQLFTWPGALIGYAWEEGDPPQAWACPSVIRFAGPSGLTHNPAGVASASYFYSVSFVTDPLLWSLDAPERRRRPLDFRKLVGMHEVQHPSDKSMFAETASYHSARPRRITEAGCESVNALFADGHASRTPLAWASPTLIYRTDSQVSWLDTAAPIPLNSTVDGVRGRDLAGR